MWYQKKGNDNDVVLSTRVRLARNIRGYPFPGKMTEKQTSEVIEKVRSALTGFEAIEIEKLTPPERASYLEKHLISREFVSAEGRRTLFRNEDKSVYVMTPEEDHLRIQSVVPGFDVDSAMANAFETEEKADGALGFAYSERYGYVTHCPTNLGTGMRISVMLHLPAYTQAGGMRSLMGQLERIGMTVRGMDGEGSRAAASLYQISNEITLGVSEEETAEKIKNVVGQIIKNERDLRGKLSEESREDLAERARRDYGILMYTHRMAAAELVGMYSDMRYAAAIGQMDTPLETLDEMLIRALPNTVVSEHENVATAADRDRVRADTVRTILKRTE